MSNDVLLFIAIGFAAQMVDGAIGMAYGITSTTILMSFGVPPATASASVHAAEVFTTAASGTAHWRMGNVDRKLVVRLAVPGVLGGGVGAYILATVPSDSIRPIVSAYLLVMGVVILWRAMPPRFAIGSANVAEFFVAVTITATFVATVGLSLWPVITGLVIGGVLAAPFAAYATKYLPTQPMMILVGVVVILLSLRSLSTALW